LGIIKLILGNGLGKEKRKIRKRSKRKTSGKDLIEELVERLGKGKRKIRERRKRNTNNHLV